MLAGFVRALVLAGAVLIGTSAAQAQKSFVRDDLASEAVRLEERVRTEAAAAREARPAAELRREFDLAMNRGDPRRALALATAAAAAEPRVAANWMAYARAANAVNPRDWSERYQLQERATTAAYLAYQRAATRADEATSLALLGETYANRQFWRYSLQAYRASLQLAEAAPVRAAYQDLREKHGFRLLDYQVDSDSASPRVCFRFSEPLRGKVDYTPFLAVTGATNLAVTAEGIQLCAEGLRHGERYGFVVRQGLPSSVDEDLLRSADYEIYVRDRSPQVRFTGRNYVLPRTGQEGIPVVSVNTGRVEVEVYRIGDRNLLPTLRSDNFLSQISASTARTMAREKGVRIWSGSLDTPLEQNRDVVTAFPVLEAVGSLEPGVYVMTARPPGAGPRASEDEEYDWGMRATQWFVVSDLGLTAFKGADGVHVFVRSLASAAPLSGTEIRLVARNNEILATKRTDARGHVAFDPGLARGEGGLAPGLVVATTGEDYGFLDFNQNAFDLSDRGVKGRPAGRGVEAYLYAERGVYRSGETVFLSALLRDARGAAVSGLPLTLVVQRPDGVEYRRTQVADQGLGGRALSVPIVPNAMRGTWRVTAYTDPKAPAVGDTSFLVEDYVPERIELTLAPKAPTLRPGEPAVIDLEARYLYGAPAANLEVSGEVTVRAGSGPAVPGLEGFVVGLEDEAVEATTAEIEDKGTTDAQGRATMQVNVPDLVAPRPTEARIALRVAEEGGRAIERTVVLPIRPKGPVLGIRKNFRDDLAEGANATFDLVLATPEGQRLARAGVTWRLYRVSRRYQWFNSDGRWGFEPVTTTRRIAEGTADIGADAPGRVSVPVEWGSYRLEARAEGIETAQTSVSFTVGWSGDATADVPDLLPMTLDKTAYAAGETMRLRLSPRYAGKATVAVVGERVNEIRVLDVAPEGTLVTIPVDPAWGTGAYVVALAHRPLDQAARRLPGRSLGVAWFEIDRAGRSLSLDLGAPAQMRPRGEMRLPIRLAGLRPARRPGSPWRRSMSGSST